MSQFPQAFTRRQTDARQDDRRETDARQDDRRETDARQTHRRETDADAQMRDARQTQTQTHAFGTLDVNRRRQTRDARETNARRRETHARQMHADARQTQTDARRETHADAQTEPDAAYSIYSCLYSCV